MANSSKRKKVQPRRHPELFDEIVWEILIRLPVESLVRFKSVCKAWHAIISDPLFVRAHLHLSNQRQRQKPSSFLVTPQQVLPGNMEVEDSPTTPFSTDIRFYQWDLRGGSSSSSRSAILLCRRQFPADEFRSMCYMAHCDGLVLLPTNTNTYVFNPVTRSAVVLPESQRNMMMRRVCLPIGISFDASTGRYKVARSFYRSHRRDYKTSGMVEMGMEVFTIGGEDGSWRETLADPPCPMLSSQTGKHCKGYLFYFINKEKLQQPPCGLLRFSLEDETFGITLLPSNMDPTIQDADILVTELDDELCCTYFSDNLQQLMIWSTGDVLNPQWSCRYIISGLGQCIPMAYLGSNGILFRQYNCLFHYYLDAHGVREDEKFNMDDLRYLGPGEDTLGSEWENMWYYDVISYTESLVPIAQKMSSKA